MTQTLYWRPADTDGQPLGQSELLVHLVWEYLQWGPDFIDRHNPGRVSDRSRTAAFLLGYQAAKLNPDLALFLQHLREYGELDVWIEDTIDLIATLPDWIQPAPAPAELDQIMNGCNT